MKKFALFFSFFFFLVFLVGCDFFNNVTTITLTEAYETTASVTEATTAAPTTAAPTTIAPTSAGSTTVAPTTTQVTTTQAPTTTTTTTQQQYTISFEENGGSEVTNIVAVAGASISAPTAPTKAGYNFIGWYTEATLTNQYSFTTMPANNLTLYAKWEAEIYILALNTNSDLQVNDISAPYLSTITLPVLVRAGYTFGGWFKDTGFTEQFTDTVMPLGDMNLYAKWTINQYTISFEEDGGSAVTDITADYTTAVTEPTDPTKEGYTFVGWYTEATLTNAYTFTTMPANDITLYAKWTVNQYTISFEEDGGSAVTDITADYATAVKAPTAPTKEGHTFVGWYAEATLTNAYTFTTMPANNITLYAKWQINSYDLVYMTDGGTVIPQETYVYGETIIKPTDPVKSGFAFGGWYSDSLFTTPFEFTTMPGSDLTLYAKWVDISQVNIPYITLTGEAEMYLVLGDTYVEPGYTAQDVEDGDLSSSVVISGTVNGSVIGTYYITYNVTDSDGYQANEVTRTVHVVDVQVGTFSNIYVPTGGDVDWDALMTNLGYTYVDPEVDTDLIQTKQVVWDSDLVNIIVYDPIHVDFVLNPGNIIFFPSHLGWNHYEIPLEIYTKMSVQFVTNGGLDTNLSVSPKSSYDNIINVMMMQKSDIFSPVYTNIILGADDYTLRAENYGGENKLFEVRVVAGSIIDDNTNQAGLNNKDITIIYDKMKTNYSFMVGGAGEVKDYTFVAYSPAKVVFSGPDGTIYESDFIDIGYYYYINFKASTLPDTYYNLQVMFYDEVTPLKAFVYDLGDIENENYVYAQQLLVNEYQENYTSYLPGSNDIVTIPGKTWFYFDVTTAGYYKFDVLYSTDMMYDFRLFDSEMMEVSYGENYIYLEPGTYYLDFIDYVGVMNFLISPPDVHSTTNNDSSQAEVISLDNEYYVDFDGDNTDKWFTFTLTEETLINVLTTYRMSIYDVFFTLYDDQLNPIFMGYEAFLEKLAAGTYYLTVSGESGQETAFMLETESAAESESTELIPDEVTIGDIFEYYLSVNDIHYYTLTLTSPQIVTMKYLGYDSIQADIVLDGNVIDYGAIYSGEVAYKYLEAGTYTVIISANHHNEIYKLMFGIHINQLPFSLVKSSAGFLDVQDIPAYYAINPNELVYFKFNAAEPVLLYSYFYNVEYIKVYNEADQLVTEGTTWSLFPLALAPGEYTFELTTEYSGLIGMHEFRTESLKPYGSTLATTTTLNNLHAIRAINYNGEVIDFMSFTLDQPTFLNFFTSANNIEYQIFDSNLFPVTGKMMSYSDYIEFLDAGTYYIIVNCAERYYELEIDNVNRLVLGTEFEMATEIFVSDDTPSYFMMNQYQPGYYAFTIYEPTYLKFNYNTNNYVIEIFDSSQDPYLDTLFTAGLYYVRISTIGSNLPEEITPIEFSVDNINSKVVNNTMATAKLYESRFYGEIVSPIAEAWFEVVLDTDSLVYATPQGSGATFEWYDSDGYFLSVVNYDYAYFPAGTYYILVTGSNVSYSFGLTINEYTPIADSASSAQELVLNDDNDFQVSASLYSTNDEDWFKLVLTEDTFYRLYAYDLGYGSITLYDASENLINTYYSSTYINLTAGVYYFKIAGSKVKYYSVSFTAHNEYLMGTDFDSAREITLSTQVDLYIGSTPQTLYYVLTLDETTTISVYIGGYSSDVVTIYAADRTTILDDDTVDSILITLDAGTYYFTFHAPWTSNRKSSFTVNVEEEGTGDELLLDNDITTPVDVTGPFFTLHQRSIDYNSSDFFRFTITEAMFYRVDMIGYNGAYIYIYDVADTSNYLLWADTYGSNVFYLEPGTYIIEVSSVWGEYEFNFVENTFIDYSDDEANPTEMLLHQNLSSYLFGATDTDYFTFTTDIERVLVFNTYSGINISILNALDEVIYTNPASLAFITLAAGTYQIQITPSTDEFTQYSLEIDDITNMMVPTDSSLAWEITPIIREQTIEGYAVDGTDVYLTFVIFYESEILFASGTTFVVLDNTLTEVTGPIYQPGTYFIKLTSGYNGLLNLSYRLISPIVYLEAEPVAIEPGIIYYGYSRDYPEVDVFTYTATEDMYLYLDFITNTFADIYIYDSLDNGIFTLSSSSPENHRFFFRAGETYTIEISSLINYYAFIILAEEFEDEGDTSATAEVIPLTQFDRTIDAITLDYLDVDWYTFTITESTTIYMTFNYGFDGIFADSDLVTPLATDSSTLVLDAGTYFIKFSNTYHTDYAFIVNVVPD